MIMRKLDYDLSRMIILFGTAFLMWLMYALATSGRKCLRGE